MCLLVLGMRSPPEDDPPDPQQIRLDRMLESEVILEILGVLVGYIIDLFTI